MDSIVTSEEDAARNTGSLTVEDEVSISDSGDSINPEDRDITSKSQIEDEA
jgi:hypothetical protein